MDNLKRVGFVAFGEVNTPYQKLVEKHDEALSQLDAPDTVITDGGIVIDDVKYEAAEAAIAKLKNVEMDCLIICVCGWIPTHAVVRVTDEFRHLPMVLWGLSAWRENGRIVTATAQAGTTALRPTFEALGYKFKYVYSIIDKPTPIGSINTFIAAAYAKRILRHAHVGTMGYRDMLLYGTQFEGSSLRKQIGIEVKPYEMLEMVQTSETIDEAAIDEGIAYVKSAWHFDTPFDDDIIRKGVTYALAIGKKIEERNWDAI